MLFAGRLGLASVLRFPPLGESSDEDASISYCLQSFQSFLNVEIWLVNRVVFINKYVVRAYDIL